MSEDKYYNIFKNAPRLITIVCEDGTLKDCNDRIDMLGYVKEKVIGKNMEIFFTESSKILARDAVKELISVGGEIDREYEMVKKSGEIIDVSIKSVIIEDEYKRKHILCFIADITKHKNAEKQLMKAAEELKKSNKELEHFAYVASHDLQEPLRAVSSYCQLLREKEYDNVDEEGKKFFDYIIDSSFRMKILIKELLDYSQVGRKDKPFEKINLQKILEEVLYDFEISIKENNASVIIENEMPKIYAVRFRIKQLFHNIISNSLKFRQKEKPIIRIGCCKNKDDNNQLLFYIKDNGIGINSEYYNRIFGVFKRLYSREEYPGTGIGLALCKKIVEAHGGKIWVESVVGEGTHIYFTISQAWIIFEE